MHVRSVSLLFARTTASQCGCSGTRGRNAVTVSVEDLHDGECFDLAIAPERALDAFYHPYAYAA